ncbi:methyl-accepting chemotaxis protein [Paracidovorax sp. MALMAid1276]|uniref:methyl-accepting chemotaxis protein n=1 Tax=Paracidovorax sp. MALMAid1276 TaxID=3411631 RepID=UPI003B9D1BD7
MLSNLKIGTRLALAFGSLALLVLLLMATALSQIGAAQQALPGGSAALAHLQSARAWVIGCSLAAFVLALVAVVSLRAGIVAPLNQAILIAETVASGDLSQEFSSELKGDFGRLLEALGTMEDTLTDLVARIKQDADAISTSAADIGHGNTDLSRHAEDQVSSLTQTAASMEQLTATVRQNAERAGSASQLAVKASQIAQHGGAAVGEVVQTMQAISGSSRKIVDIIQVIEGIAFQTNILALNAAVEAARAGEQGRGFAVVASEVRSLAQRSAAAASDIKGLIQSSVTAVDGGVRHVEEAGTAMKDIMSSVQRVGDIIGEITAAASEQSAGIGQVNSSVGEIDRMTQQNAALVEESAAAAESLREQAARLSQVVQQFRLAEAMGHGQHHTPRAVAAPYPSESQALAAGPTPARLTR